MRLISFFKSIFIKANADIEKATEEFQDNNLEAMLDDGIRQSKKKRGELTDSISRFKTILDKIEKELKTTQAIHLDATMKMKAANMDTTATLEDKKYLMSQLEEIKQEVSELQTDYNGSKIDYEEMLSDLDKLNKEILRQEREKEIIIAKAFRAKNQEEMLKIKNGVNRTDVVSFDSIKARIEKKSSETNTKVELSRRSNSVNNAPEGVNSKYLIKR